MNIKALITTALLVGSTSVALARPGSTPMVRDHRTPTVAVRGELDVRFGAEARYNSTRPVRNPIPVQTVSISHDREMPNYDFGGMSTVAAFNYGFDGCQTVALGWGREVSKLRIVSSDPTTEVYSVVVRFSNGQAQTFQWNHVFGNASDGQIGPHLDMGFAAGTYITSVEVNAHNAPGSRLAIQIAA